MTDMRIRREQRNAKIIAGATIIITALDDYQTAYPTATGARIRRYVYELLDASGIKMDDLQKRRHTISRAIAELTCEFGTRQLRAERAELARIRSRGRVARVDEH